MSEWTPERHAAAVARENAATAKPWIIDPDYGDVAIVSDDPDDGGYCSIDDIGSEADRAFIVGARNDMADMLAKIEALKCANSDLHEEANKCRVALRAATADRDHLKSREASIIEACERVADGSQYRADIVSAIQGIREQRDAFKAALLWFADEGHYEDTYRLGAGYASALGLGMAREALGLRIDRDDDTMMPLTEALKVTP